MTGPQQQPHRASDDAAAFPLSAIQRGLLVEAMMAPRVGLNVEQVVLWFDGPLDPVEVAAAWHHVQRRHEVLRVAIRGIDDGEPWHEVAGDAEIELEVHDWRLDDDSSADRVERFVRTDRARPLDLGVAPAMRVALLQRGHEGDVVVWTFPHALLDGRSFTIVAEEVLRTLASIRAGEDPAQRSPSPRFRDHVEAIGAVDHAAAEAHYRALLAGIVEPSPVPVCDDVDAVGEPRHEHEVALGPDDLAVLERTVEAAGATVGTALLAAWGVLVARYSCLDTVVVGSTRSGRHAIARAQEVVGCLINTVPVRVDAHPGRSVHDLLADVRAQQVAVRPFEHTSLVDIRRWSDVPNDVPLLRTAVVLERQLLDTHLRVTCGIAGLARVDVREESGFPILLAAYLDPELGLILRVEHSVTDDGDGRIARLAGHLLSLLQSIATATDSTTLADLRMLPAEERRQVLAELSPPLGPPSSLLVLESIARHVAERPDHVAVVAADDPDGGVTYRALAHRSVALAQILVERGARPEVPVALCLSRSPRFVEAVLACFVARVPYVPVDPTYPPDSIAHMLTDSAATVVLTDDPESAAELPRSDAAVVVLSEVAPHDDDGDPPPDLAASASTPEDTAYVIYTSGSTGAPKGVAVSQRALAELCDAVVDHYALGPDDRVLQFASLSFDVSIEELIPSLTAGATIVLRTTEMAESMAALLAAVEREQLTLLNLPTAFWHVLVDHLSTSGLMLPACVRLVIVGGERAARSALETFLPHAPHAGWTNAYGTTEATITSTVYHLPPGSALPSGELPIGSPLTNTRVYVLGGSGSYFMPIGEPGELWIGGHSVAEGYLGRADLTAERFRPDPWGPPGGRMYFTGDLARWNPDGSLEYLGRVDRQLKVRGFRIEPGEVEAALERRPAIRRAVVGARRNGGGEDLVAWVLPEPGVELDPGTMLDELRTALPAHLVPGHLVPVEDIPHTPGGKVDIAALPSPRQTRATTSKAADTVGLDDPLVAELAASFAVVLELDSCEADTSFFEAGGHSLAAVRLLSRVEQAHGRRVSLSTFHAGPTPVALAAVLRRDEDVDPRSAAYVVPIQPSGSLPPVFGVHVLGEAEVFYRPLAARLGPDQPVYGVSIPEPSPATPTAVEDLASLYRAEIDAVHPDGPLALTAVSLGSYVAFELAQQLSADGREVLLVGLFDAEGPGGRQRVDRWGRVRVHLAELRRTGWSYALGRVANVVERGRTWLRCRTPWGARARRDETAADAFLHEFVMANERAAASYRAQPYAGDVVVFRAAADHFDAPEAIADGLGWKPVVTGELSVEDVPGGHLSMLEEPHVAEVAHVLRSALVEARRRAR